ncbi:hypothetical protein C8R47DRAFT_1205329 [Mycena vitilis]|nr:hypothetical protein C8R47DRAFT_1205329 [Mycena vitilis]
MSSESPVLMYPPSSFFLEQVALDAAQLVGAAAPAEELQLTLCPKYVEKIGGNCFIYRSSATRQLFRGLLFGVVNSTNAAVAETAEAAPLSVNRITIASIPSARAAVTALFDNDVVFLEEIVRKENARHDICVRSWVGQSHNENVISFELNAYTTIVNGPIQVGDAVMADVSLHRQDAYVAGTMTRVYRLIAHDAERIHSQYIREAGLVETSSVPNDMLVDAVGELEL